MKKAEAKELLDVMKTISNSINKNHSQLIMSKAMGVEKINTVYYHGEIDDLTEEPQDYINLNVVKEIAEHLINNYDLIK